MESLNHTSELQKEQVITLPSQLYINGERVEIVNMYSVLPAASCHVLVAGIGTINIQILSKHDTCSYSKPRFDQKFLMRPADKLEFIVCME